MCGIGAIVHRTDSINNKLYEILFNLQHRGQEAAGFIVYDEVTNKQYVTKEFGLVDQNIAKIQIFPGKMGIGHVRYPTHGSATINEIQPFYTESFGGVSAAHNGNLTNIKDIGAFLSDNDIPLAGTSDSEMILHLFIYFLKLEAADITNVNEAKIENAIKGIFRMCRGSYSVIFMLNNWGLVCFRDAHGIRPLSYSTTRNSISIASETVGFDNETEYADVKNGGMLMIKDMKIQERQIVNASLMPCLFEYIYFSRPESCVNGVLVYQYREMVAEKIVEKLKNDPNFDIGKIDCVIPVPETGVISAIRVAEKLKLPIKYAIHKNRYTHRTFINKTNKDVIKAIKKIRIINKLVSNKNVLVVDDSIVRGNTSRHIVSGLKGAGATNIYMISCCPPIRYPNFYGIAIPSFSELIAVDKTIPEIEKNLGIRKLFYLDLDDLCKTLTELNPFITDFETSVFTGYYRA